VEDDGSYAQEDASCAQAHVSAMEERPEQVYSESKSVIFRYHLQIPARNSFSGKKSAAKRRRFVIRLRRGDCDAEVVSHILVPCSISGVCFKGKQVCASLEHLICAG
jgi:hypothetical protein